MPPTLLEEQDQFTETINDKVIKVDTHENVIVERNNYDLTLESITFKNIQELRNINSILFPMSYQEKYYKEVQAADSYSRLVYWRGRLVATFSCRIQAYYEKDSMTGHSSGHGEPLLECYVMTFGVLAPYRRLKMGSSLLKSIIEYHKRKGHIRRIVLHVHTANEIALQFYLHHGFKVVETVYEYYKRLTPTSGYFLSYPLIQ